MACCNWSIVVTRIEGKTFITVRGPETRATMADCPANGEWTGIQFKLGTYMRSLPLGRLRDRNDVTLAGLSPSAFTLDGCAWEYPTFENVETFVQRLLDRQLIVANSSIEATLNGQGMRSARTQQRHFRRVTALTQSAIRQILRARHATDLLRHGAPVDQVIHDLGYFDQPHLNRSLKYFIGRTPAQISRNEEQLSLLYNTGESYSGSLPGIRR